MGYSRSGTGGDTSGLATDSAVVHLAGSETVTGAKNFTGGISKSGNAVVDTTDARLSDTRTPTAHNHAGSEITSSTVAVARLGSGTPSSANFLRGDGTWDVPHIGAHALDRSGQYRFLHPHVTAGTIATMTNGTLRLSPVFVHKTQQYVRIGGEVTAGGDAAARLRLGVYADDGTGYPGALLYDAGASGSASTVTADGLISGASATVQEVTVDFTLTPGVWWVGGVLQGVTVTQPTFRTSNLLYNLTGATTIPASNQVYIGYSQASVTGALPANFTTTVSASTVCYRVFAKAA